jgi:hypothetical protein
VLFVSALLIDGARDGKPAAASLIPREDLAMQSERTFRTDGGRDASANMETIQISGLTCRVKKITVSDEGKLTMAIDATVTDNEAIERVRDLIMIQQGEVMMTLEGVMVESTEQAH